MRFEFTSLLLILFSFSEVFAVPVRNSARSFKITRRVALTQNRSGAAALGRAYHKFGWTVPEGLNSHIQATKLVADGGPNESGSVKASPEEGDTEFLSPINIGGQTLMMDFDTGSSDLWVFNTKLQHQETKGHSIFDPSRSSTFKLLQGSSFAISYGDQSKASGLVGTDTVNIGGATVENQAVELATDISDGFASDVESDGLVGLAFSSINQVQPKPQKTFFDNIQPTLDKPVFTANLKHATLGNYEFGRIDDTQHQGPIAYTPVNDTQGFWQFESNSFAVGNGHVQTNPNASPAIADTGTSLIVADDNVVRSYWRNVQGAQDSESGITFPCNSQLPDLHIAVGPKYMATIPGALMSFQRLHDEVCYGGLQSNQGQPLQILGDVMFKALFVVFDGGEKRIGFAPHA